jgi:hypothetical protein
MIGILRCGQNTDVRRPSMMQAYVVASIVSQNDTSQRNGAGQNVSIRHRRLTVFLSRKHVVTPVKHRRSCVCQFASSRIVGTNLFPISSIFGKRGWS